jgi:uncharacterized Zn finger protein (UPF0148 family)
MKTTFNIINSRIVKVRCPYCDKQFVIERKQRKKKVEKEKNVFERLGDIL